MMLVKYDKDASLSRDGVPDEIRAACHIEFIYSSGLFSFLSCKTLISIVINFGFLFYPEESISSL